MKGIVPDGAGQVQSGGRYHGAGSGRQEQSPCPTGCAGAAVPLNTGFWSVILKVETEHPKRKEEKNGTKV